MERRPPEGQGHYLYYNALMPVFVSLSLWSCAYNLYRVRQRSPIGLFSLRKVREGPRAPSRFFDTMVYVLTTIQLYMYTTIALFLPLVWLLPDVRLVGRLEKLGWFYQKGPNRVYNYISFIDYQLVMPAFYLEHLWHGVIAYELHALIAQHKPSEVLHRGLKKAFFLVVAIVTFKWSLEMLSIFHYGIYHAQYISSAIMHSFLFFFTALAYGHVIFTLRRARSTRSLILRSIRDRLLILCGCLMVQLATRVVLICWGLSGAPPFLPLQIISNSFILLRGFVDSMVLGNICNYGRLRERMPFRRQTSDNRVRVGSSVKSMTEGSWVPPHISLCYDRTGSTTAPSFDMDFEGMEGTMIYDRGEEETKEHEVYMAMEDEEDYEKEGNTTTATTSTSTTQNSSVRVAVEMVGSQI